VQFPCPYLSGAVELTEEREKHIGERHPDLLPKFRDRIRATLADPDEVRRSARSANARRVKPSKNVTFACIRRAI